MLRKVFAALALFAALLTAVPTAAQVTPSRVATVYAKIASGPAYLPQAVTLFAAMTSAPDATRKGLINTEIGCEITAGTWALTDWHGVLAAGNSHDGLLNWKDPTKSLSIVGSVTFTTDRGFQLAASSASNYLLGPDLFNAGSNVFALNSAHISMYLNLFTITSYSGVIATNTGYNGGLGQDQSSSWFAGYVNTTTQSMTTFPADSTSSDYLGMWSETRTASNAQAIYKSGAAVAGNNSWTDTSASTAIPVTVPRPLFGDGNNFWNPPNTNDRLAYYGYGGGFSSGNAAAQATCMTAYLTAIGAN